MAFECVRAKKASTLRKALEASGLTAGDGDAVCYSVVKKENVSGKKAVALLKNGHLISGDAARRKLGLPKSGGKAGHVSPADVPSGYAGFVQSTSHNRKVKKDALVLLLRKEEGHKRGMKRPAAASLKRPAASGAGAAARVPRLLAQFQRFGECGPAAPASRVPEGIPAELRGMMLASADWHIQKQSYGVFGLNFFDKKTGFLDKVMLMGDEDLVLQWRKEKTSPNCAEDAWQCIAAFSEYDFIFANVDPGSPNFGATRHIVNNCFEDKPFTEAPFSNFFAKVEAFVGQYVKYRADNADNSDWEDDAPQFRK